MKLEAESGEGLVPLVYATKTNMAPDVLEALLDYLAAAGLVSVKKDGARLSDEGHALLEHLAPFDRPLRRRILRVMPDPHATWSPAPDLDRQLTATRFGAIRRFTCIDSTNKYLLAEAASALEPEKSFSRVASRGANADLTENDGVKGHCDP